MTGQLAEQSEDLSQAIDQAGTRLADVREAIGARVFGQERVVEQALCVVLAGGHGLLVGPPGTAKTRLVSTLGTVLGLGVSRIQFTPDLMPSDILGAEVLEESASGQRAFRFIEGPVFAQLVMADEINRASPRTQSALLEAMQEHQVTIAGQRKALPAPFHVLATQNPIEFEGTYPLPEAQLDRFLLRIDVGFPDRETERRVMLETTGLVDPPAQAVLASGELQHLQALVRQIPVGAKAMEFALDLVRAARPESPGLPEVASHVQFGPGPRAGQALVLAARARALARGRGAASLDDMLALAVPVLTHRMGLAYSARLEGVTAGKLIEDLCLRLQRAA